MTWKPDVGESHEFSCAEQHGTLSSCARARSVRKPHWHPNAHELTYCAKGSSLVTVFSNGNLHGTFTIAEGVMFFVPSGYLHAIVNTGGESAEFLVAFSNHEPEDFGMSGAVGCMNANVMGNTFGISQTATTGIRYSPEDVVIGKYEGTLEVPWAAGFSNHYKLAAESLPPMLATNFGSARTARKQFWPVLEGLAMYSLRLFGTGMREPHWHPQTAEMGYALQGNARMTLLSPGASVDTYLLGPGDMYFIPKGWAHHIENLRDRTAVPYLLREHYLGGHRLYRGPGRFAAEDYRADSGLHRGIASSPLPIPPISASSKRSTPHLLKDRYLRREVWGMKFGWRRRRGRGSAKRGSEFPQAGACNADTTCPPLLYSE